MGQSSLTCLFNLIISMKMFVVLALAAVAYAEPEAEAFNPLVYTAGVAPVRAAYSHVAAPLTTYSHAVSAPVSTYVNAPVSTYSHAVAAPVATYSQVAPVATYSQVAPVATYSQASPVASYVASKVATPVVSSYNHIAAPVSAYAAMPMAHQAITSYKSPHHYTAVGNGVTAPKYVAKNHGVEHVVKREAEADAQYITPSVYTHGLVNSVAPVNTFAYSAAVAPATYTNAVHHSVAAPVTYTNAVHHSVAAPVAYTNTMAYAAKPVMTYNAYNTVAAGHHAVAATPFGYTHSSNVGLCYNNMGAQVEC